MRFGPGDRLFGIFAYPADRSSSKPTIILLNTGAGHHVGPHRLSVPLAREWAARGHHVLRFDLGGIGDSLPPAAADGNVVYPDHMIDDAREAIAFVRTEAPERQVIAAGLCSGGWLAFQAARQNLAVDAIVAINAPLYLRDGDREWLREGRAIERYQQSMRDPSKWLKALRGRTSPVAFTRVAASALARRVAVRINGALGDTLTDGLGRDLRAIADRRIKCLFVFSRGDSGYAVLPTARTARTPPRGRARLHSARSGGRCRPRVPPARSAADTAPAVDRFRGGANRESGTQRQRGLPVRHALAIVVSFVTRTV